MRDKKGYLPAHVACSRHCSPRKLQMLLDINPDALFEKTKDGHTLLSLAVSTATVSHPNFKLIEEIKARLGASGGPPQVSSLSNSGSLAPTVSVDELETSRASTATPPLENFGLVSPCQKSQDLDEMPPSLAAESPVDLLLHFSRSKHMGESRDDSEESSADMVEV